MKKTLSRTQRNNLTGTLFAAPPVLGFFLFGCIPMVLSLFLSFGELSSFNMFEIKLTGLQNYIKIFTEDKRFFESIGNTFIYAIGSVFIGLAISLFLAVLMNRKIRFVRVFRIIIFIPYVCSVVATSTMWKWIFDYNYGVLNDVMDFLGLARVDWLNNSGTIMPCMIAMSVWGSLGYNIILFSAALGSVNKSYYEAAQIDGANKFTIFFKVTFPLISSTTFFLVIMGFIGALQTLANFQVMTPTQPWNSMTFYVYFMAFEDFSNGMGYASALGWIVGLIVMVFTIINFAFSKKWVHYD